MESIDGYKEPSKDDRRRGNQGKNDRRRDESRREDKRDKRDDPKKERERMVFTLLNTPISKILNEIKGMPDFRRPAKLRVPDHKKNGNKYCDYHQDRAQHGRMFPLEKASRKNGEDGRLESIC